MNKGSLANGAYVLTVTRFVQSVGRTHATLYLEEAGGQRMLAPSCLGEAADAGPGGQPVADGVRTSIHSAQTRWCRPALRCLKPTVVDIHIVQPAESCRSASGRALTGPKRPGPSADQALSTGAWPPSLPAPT